MPERDPTYRFRAADHLQDGPAQRSIQTKQKAARARRAFREMQNPDHEGPSLSHQLARMIADGISGRGQDDSQAAYEDRVQAARETCRSGNPFPLIALQWPTLVIQSPDEIQHFRAACSPARYRAIEGLPTALLELLCDDSQPALRLDWWQRLIIASFFDQTISELYIKGCTGAGKGGSTAIAVNLWFDVHHNSRTTLTSETYEHAIKNIYGEVRLWRNRMVSPFPARVLAEGMTAAERHYVQVRNPAAGDGEAFSGQHGPNTLYTFDEATAIDDNLFDNAEKNATKIVALANPRTLGGRFRRAFEPLGRDRMDSTAVVYGNMGQRLCVTVGGLDCINVAQGRLRKPVAPRSGITIEGQTYEQGQPIPPDAFQLVRALIPDQIDVTLFRNNCAKPEREADVFAHGRFPKEDTEKQVVLGSWLPRHVGFWESVRGELPVQAFGLDVARSLEGDETVLTAGGKQGLREQVGVRLTSVVAVSDWVEQLARDRYGIELRQRTHPIVIDYGGGYGGGVGDVLEGRGCWVVAFQPSGTSGFPRHYTNQRTESYALLGKRLDPSGQFGEQPFGLPPDEALLRELCAVEKQYGTDAIRFGLQSKDEVKRKLSGNSPDRGDSAVLCFAGVRMMTGYDELVRRFADRVLVHFPALPPDPKTRDELSESLRASVPPEPLLPSLGLELDLTPGGQEPKKAPDRYANLASFYRDQYGPRGRES